MDNMSADEQLKTLQLLREVQLPCYDNGKEFTNMGKLDKIAESLKGTSYVETKGSLFRLYAKDSIESFECENVVVLSTHADFVKSIKHPFVKYSSEYKLLAGTFDNSATNAAALYLMQKDSLPDNVLVAFTGNEESGMKGASELSAYLHKFNITPFFLVLDVTNIGFGKKSFSIENTFSLSKFSVDKIVQYAKETGNDGFLYPNALPDEAHAYARLGESTCSLCVPTEGPMHSDKGCLMLMDSYIKYISVLEHIAQKMAPPTRKRVSALELGC